MCGAFPSLLLCLLSAVSAGARGEGGRAPVALLLVSGLGYEDLKEGRPAATLRPLTKKGMPALLEPSAAGELTEAAAYLSVGAGAPVAAPESGGKTITEGGLTRTMAEVAQDVYPFAGVEAEVVARGYRRRYGEYPPLESVVVDLGVPALRDGRNDAATPARIGALGYALKKARLRVAVYGDWRAISVGMDERGAVYAGSLRPIAPENLEAAIRASDVTIVNAATPRTLRMYVAALKNAPDINLLIAAIAPSFAVSVKPVRWASPGFLLGVGPAFVAESVPVSLTTHLPGLVSALDIAPTVAALSGASFDGGAGSSLMTAQKIKTSDSLASLTTLARQIKMRDKALRPVRLSATILASLGLSAMVLTVLFRRQWVYRVTQLFFWFVASLPVALLVAGVLAPSPIGIYLTVTALLAAGAALGALTVRRLPFSALAIPFLLTAGVILLDCLTGQTLLYRSAMFEGGISEGNLSAAYLALGIASGVGGVGLMALGERSRRIVFGIAMGLAGCYMALREMGFFTGIGLLEHATLPIAVCGLVIIVVFIEMLCASSLSTMEQNELASR